MATSEHNTIPQIAQQVRCVIVPPESASPCSSLPDTPPPSLNSGTLACSVASATGTVRRRGPCLSRRTGQNGYVYQRNRTDGERWNPKEPAYGRFWIDTPTGRKRANVSLGLHRTHTLAYQKLQEEIAAAGVNDPANFEANTAPTVTFAGQAKKFMTEFAQRRRRPPSAVTIANYQWLLDSRIILALGDKPLSEISNGALKKFVDALVKERLGSKTIKEYAMLVKRVVASAVDEDGDRLYPRDWNHEFIGVPIVDKTKQHRPTTTAEQVEYVLAKVKRCYYVLFALLAGVGLRIEEALALRASHVKDGGHIVQVRRSICPVTGEDREGTKSKAGIRDIDVPEPLAHLLGELATERATGYLFRTRNGTHYTMDNLGKMLRGKRVGVKGGLRMFRRFRAEVLRKAGVPEDLVRYWMGHAGHADEIGEFTRSSTVTDLYAAGAKNDTAWRRQWCEKVGLGFTLVPPRARKSAPNKQCQLAVESPVGQHGLQNRPSSRFDGSVSTAVQ